jgi:DNA-binding transcriptional LysR family regulator
VALFGGNEAVREAVKAGVGLSMLSRRSVAADLSAGALVEIPLQGVSGERPFYLLRRRNRQLPPSAAALAEHLLAAATRDAGSSPA